ncbi:citramalate synthase [Desulfobotulus mexicanus]|uniref:Citramalate synthase n=1 Tax=Desulfobotulus mexicanus TaxID=2586642 RepID=A0A5Q4VI81_9BACT|nr:citramalate synthase [Desulfobotulus mexicanus]TYT75701.1 citramalate synthase [Desulfobotulus mexicanus]
MTSMLLYDTTLRDGAQGEHINFSAEDKMKIALRLDDMGFHYIEGGWPGANPKDTAFFEAARSITFKNAKLAAFGSTCRPGMKPGDDPLLKALAASEAPVITLFGKTWDLHIERIMENTLEENLRMIRESVGWFVSLGREVIYDAEHFFDGYKDNRDYALETLAAAWEGGSEVLTLCDTNGGSLPHEIEAIMEDVKGWFAERSFEDKRPLKLGIHAHNDSNLAVANSITAVRSGAVMVQGTINGYGERCGNADLTSIIPVMQLKMSIDCMVPERLARIKSLSRFVSETANVPPLNSRPFVGKSAFAHKGGAHVSAVLKEPRGYEHMTPELVGNERRVIMSDYSGKSNVTYKAKEMGIDMEGVDSREVVSEIKRLEQEGYQFEAAEGSFRLLVERMAGRFKPRFQLKNFRVTVEKDKDRHCSSHAVVHIDTPFGEEMSAASGDGPVSALDNALRKALECFYPRDMAHMQLVDYKVRVLDGAGGTASKVRVLIESRDPDTIWSTIGVSEDIIEASWQALADSFHYKLGSSEI